jgi:glycosyltransferase involved in cell wall biosynthesis
METIFINHRSGHHAKNSGYNRLIDFFENSVLIPNENFKLSDRIKKTIANYTNQEAGLYNSTSVQKDFELAKHIFSLKNKNRVVHYLNGEYDLRFITKIKKIYTHTKVCSTFHYPPSVLEKNYKNNSYFKKINGAIAVSENQVNYLKNWLNLEHVKFIPHGVETNFFKPNETIKKENTLLFVGQHLRDFEALNFAVPRLKEKIPSIKIIIVLKQDFANKVIPNDCLTIYSGINDNELLKLYQEATLLFLPLIDATACNSILEALSCGLPIISTTIDGNKSYVKNSSGILTPQKDYIALIDETINLLKNKDLQMQMSINARETALEFEWQNVANEIAKFHQKLI